MESVHLDVLDAILPFVPKALVDNLISSVKSSNLALKPSIRKVKGALLFVDISGFSALANTISADDLQSVISNYFSLLLEIVNDYNGDIIKYAGDAIFVLWSTQGQSSDEYAREIRHALACGAEINRKCCNFKVRVAKGFSWLNSLQGGEMKAGETPNPNYDLNVHSSLTCGQIYVVNIGYEGRWECLLLGEPVNELSKTIDQAVIGKMVLSDACHAALSKSAGSKLNVEVQDQGDDTARQTCDCKRLHFGCYEFCFEDHESELSNTAPEDSLYGNNRDSIKLAIELFHSYRAKARKPIDASLLSKFLYRGIFGHVHGAARNLCDAEGNRFVRDAGSIADDVNDEASGLRDSVRELRDIVTIFIKLDVDLSSEDIAESEDLTLGIENCGVLQRLQKCMEICIRLLNAQGGQLRQFIVDDKGCMCIANFGLHLSMTLDNCAAAVSAAQNIEASLAADVGVECSIGISSGNVYCGLIGVDWRHEYTCIGTSVNLAARLMNAASKSGKSRDLITSDALVGTLDDVINTHDRIRCDKETQRRDKSHSYVILSSIKAKGYPDPVATFRPIRYRTYNPASNIDSICGFTMKPVNCGDVLSGRLGELEDTIDFFLRTASGHEKAITDTTSKILVVVGEESIGADAFLAGLGTVMSSLTSPWRHACFRGRARASKGTTRFSLWINIFDELLSYMGQILTTTKTVMNTTKKSLKYIALEFILSRLPPPIRDLSPLLVHFGIIPNLPEFSDNNTTSRLTSALKLTKTIEFMTLALEVATDFIRKSSYLTSVASIVFIIENIQLIDSSSWALVENILLHGKGILFAVSYVPNYTSNQKMNEKRGDGDTSAGGGDLTSRNPSNTFSQMDSRASADDIGDLTDEDNTSQSRHDDSSTFSSFHDFSTGSMDSLSGSSILQYAQQMYSQDKSRARCLYLGPLSREAVWQLVMSVYNKFFKTAGKFEIGTDDESVKRVDDAIDKLYFSSGGHPLHVLEITASIIQTGKCESPLEFIIKLEQVLSNIASNNIDDLIFYNFDLLSPNCQLLLKAASVIAATGSAFSATLLGSMLCDDVQTETFNFPTDVSESFTEAASTPASPSPAKADTSLVDHVNDAILGDSDSSDEDDVALNVGKVAKNGGSVKEEVKSVPKVPSSVNMVSIFGTQTDAITSAKLLFREILAKSTFLRRFNNSSDDSVNESREVYDCDSNQMDFDDQTLFHFASVIYQGPIYKMMLNQQKAELHTRLAKYLEAQEMKAALASDVAEASKSKTVPSIASGGSKPVRIADNESESSQDSASRGSEIASAWQIQGYHWNHAGVWMKASACFFQAAKILTGEGAYNDANMYFCWAYNMLQALRQQAGDHVAHRIAIDPSTGQCTLHNFNGTRYVESSGMSSDGDFNDICDDMSTGSRSSHGSASSGSAYRGRKTHGGSASHDGSTGSGEQASGGSENALLEKAISATLNLAAGAMPMAMGSKSHMESRASKALYDVFQGDILSLETSIMMLIRFSQSLLLTHDDQTVVSIILKDALQLIMLSRRSTMKNAGKRFKLDFFHRSFLPAILYAQLASADADRAKKQTLDYSGNKTNLRFYLRDTSVIFPILSALSLQYITGYFRDDEEYSKLTALEETFLAISQDYKDPVHIIRALTVSDWRLSALHRFVQVVKCADRIRHIYDFDTQSRKLISVYGTDVALQSLVSGIRGRILLGDFSGANESYAFARRQLSVLKHVHTMELCTVSLCVTLLLMEMYDEAVNLFFEYFNIEVHAEGYSMFREYNPYIAEMLLQLSSLSDADKEKRRQSVKSGTWVTSIRVLLPNGKPNQTKRSQAVSTLEMHGIGVDYVKASLLFLRAKRNLKDLDSINSDAVPPRDIPSPSVSVGDNSSIFLGDSSVHSVSPIVSIINDFLAALSFADAAGDLKNQANELNQLLIIWLRGEVLALLSSLHGSFVKDKEREEAYAILSLNASLESFTFCQVLDSPMLKLLTGQRADRILSTLQPPVHCSSTRLLTQGQIAELSANAILGFSAEKMKPLVDFSRSTPISSLRREEVSVKVKTSSDYSTTVKYWARPWLVKSPK